MQRREPADAMTDRSAQKVTGRIARRKMSRDSSFQERQRPAGRKGFLKDRERSQHLVSKDFFEGLDVFRDRSSLDKELRVATVHASLGAQLYFFEST